jgi:cell division septal protein FtsQ
LILKFAITGYIIGTGGKNLPGNILKKDQIFMAQVRKNQTKRTASAAGKTALDQERRKFKRGTILLIVLILAVAAVILGLFWLKSKMLNRNPRLTLQVVRISSTGYWGQPGNDSMLVENLNLSVGSDNLMNMDLAELRKKLLAIPNVADGRVSLELPDTLNISIDERVPKAFLSVVSDHGKLVIDANGLIMSADQCFGVHDKLPVITVVGGSRHKYKPGDTAQGVTEALELLNAMQESSQFEASDIYILRDKNILSVKIFYHTADRKREAFDVKLPLWDCDYAEQLKILQPTIEYMLKTTPEKRKIDLSIPGQGTIKK